MICTSLYNYYLHLQPVVSHAEKGEITKMANKIPLSQAVTAFHPSKDKFTQYENFSQYPVTLI